MIIFFKIIKTINIVFYINNLLSVLIFSSELSHGKRYRDVNELKRDYLKPFVSYLNEDAVFSCPLRTKNKIIMLKKREILDKINDSDGNDNVQYIIKRKQKTLLKRSIAEDKLENDEFSDKHGINNNDVFVQSDETEDNRKVYNLKDMLKSIQNDINFYERDKLIKFTKRNIKEGLEKLKRRDRKRRKNGKSQKREEMVVNFSTKKVDTQNNLNENLLIISDPAKMNYNNKTKNRYTRYLKGMAMPYDESKTISPSKMNFKQIDNKNLNDLNQVLSHNILRKISSKRSDTELLNLLSSLTNNNSSSDSVNTLITGINNIFGTNDLSNNSYKSNDVNDNGINKLLKNDFIHKKVIPLFTPIDNSKEPMLNGKLNISSSWDTSNSGYKNNSQFDINKSNTNNKVNRYDDDYENGNSKYNPMSDGSAVGNNESNVASNVDTETTGKTQSFSDFSEKSIGKIINNSVYKNPETNSLLNNFTQTIMELQDKDSNHNNTINYGDLSKKTDSHSLDTDGNLNSLLVDHYNENSSNKVGNGKKVDINKNLDNKSSDSDYEEPPKKSSMKSKKPYPDSSKNISSAFEKSNQMFLNDFSTRKNINAGPPNRTKVEKSNVKTPLNDAKKNKPLSTISCTSSINDISNQQEEEEKNQQPTQPQNQLPEQTTPSKDPLQQPNNKDQQKDVIINQMKPPLLKNITVNLTCADEIKVNATINFNYENNTALNDSLALCSPASLSTSFSRVPCDDLFLTIPTSSYTSLPKKSSDRENILTSSVNDDNNMFTSNTSQNLIESSSMYSLSSSSSTNGTSTSYATFKCSSLQDNALTTVDVLNLDNIHNKVVMNMYNHSNKSNLYIKSDNSFTTHDAIISSQIYNSGKKKLSEKTVSPSVGSNKSGSDNLHLKIIAENMNRTGGNGVGLSYSKSSSSGESDSGHNILKGNSANNNTNINKSTHNGSKTLNNEDYEDEDYINSNTKSSVVSYPTLTVY